MSNETNTSAPLAATLGERLEEKAHEGAGPAPEQVAAAALGAQGEGAPAARSGHGREARRRAGRERPRRGTGGGSRASWGLAAGIGAFAAMALVRRLFRR